MACIHGAALTVLPTLQLEFRGWSSILEVSSLWQYCTKGLIRQQNCGSEQSSRCILAIIIKY